MFHGSSNIQFMVALANKCLGLSRFTTLLRHMYGVFTLHTYTRFIVVLRITKVASTLHIHQSKTYLPQKVITQNSFSVVS